ncbi:MAG TPA: glycoside hydrolase family 3 C-terminal domain-containing protein [Chthoniobacteraceae bacterium]|nr:glycoside hydrolase family 3 C-terminal domain-containing protein [Chthoniobacteraceae bacterium]
MKIRLFRWMIPCLGILLIPSLHAQDRIYKDPTQSPDKRAEDLLSQMTEAEKFTLIAGSSRVMGMQPVPRLGIPEFLMTDAGMGGVEHGPSTAYPGGMGLAATWDVEQAQRDGTSQARDTRSRGEQIILGPAMDLYRAPMCGRNFEYFGEDPLLSGYIAAAYVKGAQSQGIGVACKHFACNDQEPKRNSLNSEVDERTLRELDLKPFEICVKQGGALGFMCSYNPLNGVYTSANKWLLTDILKNEWGYKGLVMSDWGACHDTAGDINAGLDLEEPHGQYYLPQRLQPLLDNGTIKQASIDDQVRRILRVAFTLGWFDRQLTDSSIPKDDPASCAVALKGAEEGVTLLKNAGNLLPANPAALKQVVVLGPNADPAMYGGGGSSHVGVFHAVSVYAGIKDLLSANIAQGAVAPVVTRIPYHAPPAPPKGNRNALPTPTPTPDPSYDPLAGGYSDQVRSADLAVVCVGFNAKGQPNGYEGEGTDRSYILPIGQQELIKAVAALNPHTVVIVNAGGSVATADWIDKVPALIDAFYPGQEGGTAIANILFGKVNPSGHLCFTWDKKWEDCPSFGNYPLEENKFTSNTYKEGVFAGYRWYDAKNIEPLYPFGFGLSYTTFQFSNAKASAPDANGNITVTATITNTGKMAGAEVAQLYVQPPAVQPQKWVDGPVYPPSEGAPAPMGSAAQPVVVTRPVRELKGFTRLELQPGESKTATITLNRADLAYWDPNSKKWTVTPGAYVFSVGGSSRDLPVHTDISL